MPPIYEFCCITTECCENQGHPSTGTAKIVERLAKPDEVVKCYKCSRKMLRVINSAPRGYVRGTSNYVKN